MGGILGCRSFLSYVDALVEAGKSDGADFGAFLAWSVLRVDAMIDLVGISEDGDFSAECVDDAECFTKWMETKYLECTLQ